jgi:lipopolysaccharide transport system permease protein
LNTGNIKALGKYKDLLLFRVLLESRTETRQFYLGLAWWIIEPVINLSVMYLVFGVIMQRGGPGFAGFLLVGFVFFRWADGAVKRALVSFSNSRAIITEVMLPSWLFPLSDILASSLRFLIILALLIIFCIWYSGQIGWAYLALPLILALNLGFIVGLGLTLSLLPPFIPDSRKIIDNVFTLLFFASGIFYDISKLPPETASYLYLNPIAAFISSYRLILL